MSTPIPAWRRDLDAAIARGKRAAKRISARDLEALLKLSTERRQEILDQRVSDRRLVNLLPGDRQKLRESLGKAGKPKKPTVLDPEVAAKLEAEAAARRASTLQEYVTGYKTALKTTHLVDVTKAFIAVFKDPEQAAKAAISALAKSPSAALERYPDYGPRRWFVSQEKNWAAYEALERAARTAEALAQAREEIGGANGKS
jgi:hypothetical protein